MTNKQLKYYITEYAMDIKSFISSHIFQIEKLINHLTLIVQDLKVHILNPTKVQKEHGLV